MLVRKPGQRFLVSLLVAALLVAGLLQPAATREAAVRVIVRGRSMTVAEAAVAACAGSVESTIRSIDAVVASVSEACAAELSTVPGVLSVTADRQVQLAVSQAGDGAGRGNDIVSFTDVIGVQDIWDTGNLGAGVTVAVLDTGIDPALSELRRTQDAGNLDRFLAYYDAIEGQLYEHPFTLRSPRDPNGHGSHVAGIIANGSYDGEPGSYRGVAPAANLVAVRVLNEDGTGSYGDVIEGIQWVIDHKDTYGIRVLNISMYSVPVAPYWADPYNQIVMAAWNAGIVVVASVGNTGPAPMSVGVPGNTPYIITVGAFTDHRTPEDFGDDYIPEFSAAGPTLDAFVKPDVIAPGAHVVSLMRPNSYLRDQYPERRVDGRYFEMSGTSMSTASVSGIAALILSENPDLSPDEVKYRLTQSARPQVNADASAAAYSIWQQGAGRVWAPDAVLGGLDGAANLGMDIVSDLAGERHYQGWTTYEAGEPSGTFHLIGGGFDEHLAGYTAWDGSFVDWADGYDSLAGEGTNWADSFDSWADSFDSWADSFDSWADSFDSWADSFDSWADSFDSWADTCLLDGEDGSQVDSFDSWADSFDSWADSFDSWADSFDSWADYVVWADSFDSWADSFDSWADGLTGCDGTGDSFDSWADSFDSWADAYIGWVARAATVSDGLVIWSGAYSSWSGGYLTWSTSFDSWADSFDSWADGYGAWAEMCGIDPDSFDSWADSQPGEIDSFDSWADSFDSWADSFDSWADGLIDWDDYPQQIDAFGVTADSFDSWADNFVADWQDWTTYSSDDLPESCGGWVDSFDSWADSFDSWADSFDSWADSFDSWADSFDSWADANLMLTGEYTVWDGGYTTWAGGYRLWPGSFDSWADQVGDPDWAAAFISPNVRVMEGLQVGINLWVVPLD